MAASTSHAAAVAAAAAEATAAAAGIHGDNARLIHPNHSSGTCSLCDPQSKLELTLGSRPAVSSTSKISQDTFSNQISKPAHFIKDAHRSYPVDLHQVSARLFKFLAEERNAPGVATPGENTPEPGALSDGSFNSPSLPIPPETKAPATDEEKRLDQVQRERVSYAKLVHDGGWPWYPISQLERVSTKHDECQFIKYWHFRYPPENNDGGWMVYTYQWARWKRFRRWQARMREENFDEYYEEMVNRLERWSCSFDLKRHPDEQDRLATFYEYFNFELIRAEGCWDFRSEDAGYHRAWQRLKDTGVLGKNENARFIETSTTKKSRKKEKDELRVTVESESTAMLLATRDRMNPNLDDPDMYKLLEETQIRLNTSIDRYEERKEYLDKVELYLQETQWYRFRRDWAMNHAILMRWFDAGLNEIRKGMGPLGPFGVDSVRRFSYEFEDEDEDELEEDDDEFGYDGDNDDEEDYDEEEDDEEEDENDLSNVPEEHERGYGGLHTPNSYSSKRNRSDDEDDGDDDQHPKRARELYQMAH